MSFIKKHPVISIIGLLILLAIIGLFLPNKQNENLQEINTTLDEPQKQNTLIPYTNQSCEDIKPNINEMRIFFSDNYGSQRYSDERPILQNGEELIMNSGCINEKCSGYYESSKYDRDENGNLLQRYRLNYFFNFVPEECIYDGDSGVMGVYKTCKITNITCEVRNI